MTNKKFSVVLRLMIANAAVGSNIVYLFQKDTIPKKTRAVFMPLFAFLFFTFCAFLRGRLSQLCTKSRCPNVYLSELQWLSSQFSPLRLCEVQRE